MTNDDGKTFTKAELVEAIHDAAADVGLLDRLDEITKRQEDTFKLLAVDPDSASETRTFQANMAFLHRFRALSEKVGATMILTVATIVTGGGVALVWAAIKNGTPKP